VRSSCASGTPDDSIASRHESRQKSGSRPASAASFFWSSFCLQCKDANPSSMRSVIHADPARDLVVGCCHRLALTWSPTSPQPGSTETLFQHTPAKYD